MYGRLPARECKDKDMRLAMVDGAVRRRGSRVNRSKSTSKRKGIVE